jgi:hypothetical protein
MCSLLFTEQAYYLGDQIKENEMRKACSTRRRDEKCESIFCRKPWTGETAWNTWIESLNGRDRLEHVGRKK